MARCSRVRTSDSEKNWVRHQHRQRRKDVPVSKSLPFNGSVATLLGLPGPQRGPLPHLQLGPLPGPPRGLHPAPQPGLQQGCRRKYQCFGATSYFSNQRTEHIHQPARTINVTLRNCRGLPASATTVKNANDTLGRPGSSSNRLHHGSTAMARHPGRAMACQT